MKKTYHVEDNRKVVTSNNIDQDKSELNSILETAYDGIVAVDKDGFITFISKAYAEFLDIDYKSVLGKHVTSVIENTRMHIVASTGVEELCDIQKIKGSYMIASRYPLYEKGEVVGAVGKVLFKNIIEFNRINNKINKMEEQLEKYKGELKNINKAKYSFDNIIGSCRKILECKKYAMKAAKTDSNVLLTGESGTGKELFAHGIHNNSIRRNGPFVKVNCAAIPKELLESELFGYEDGAFTGAKKGGKLGKFEMANGGTIFLDEIGDMPLYMQAKLLRVLQEKEIEKIGGVSTKSIDVRIISATNLELKEQIVKEKFRQDLYYRLNVLNISLPPLRERLEDIEELSYSLLNKHTDRLEVEQYKISENALNLLRSYSWPGNVRELSNILERAIHIVDKGNIIEGFHLPNEIIRGKIENRDKSLQQIMDEAERDALLHALRVCGGNRSKAANLLKVSRTTFYNKLEKYNLIFE